MLKADPKEIVYFHLGDVLSVILGVDFNTHNTVGINDILSFLIQDKVTDLSADNATKLCAPYLISQHPWLDEINSEVNRANPHQWLKQAIDKYGEYIAIKPIAHIDTLA